MNIVANLIYWKKQELPQWLLKEYHWLHDFKATNTDYDGAIRELLTLIIQHWRLPLQ